MSVGDWFIIVFIVIALVGVGLYYLNKWANKKVTTQNTMINSMKQSQTVYVIDKKKDKIDNANLPKAMVEQIPKYQKILKSYFVKVKIGPQILTLMCDKQVFNAIPLKKNVKIELAGVYIVSVAGMKSKEEIKEIEKNKKAKAKAAKKDAKKNK
ncbi:MAG: hypothetical protein ACK5LV_01855 [Lachnospirales bacterium]